MSTVYQEMVETIVGKVMVRAYASEGPAMCRSMSSLENFQQIFFVKMAIQSWLGLRMAMIGYTLMVFAKLRPVLQYYGYLAPTSAALVGFSIAYSTQTVQVIQQFINNYSELEMQLISIERLREYAQQQELEGQQRSVTQPQGRGPGPAGLHLRNLQVTYREGLQPALSGVSLDFAPGEAAAIMGRTGAGKTSLLLAVLQLVPYTGIVEVDGRCLAECSPSHARRHIVGVVPQSPVLFAGSLRMNLDPEGIWSERQLWAALEVLGLRAMVRAHGGGLDARVTGSCEEDDGGSTGRLSLSQGQRQLLCASRVVLRQPRVVMLDEITASLPSEVAGTIVATLVRQFKQLNATVLMVTHQEDLIPYFERVITIAGGAVADDRRSSVSAP
jgi:ABC-type multidrug transport system fused ATPase/permease subunit